jgi:hypothetical protein
MAGTPVTNPSGVNGITAGNLNQTHWYVGCGNTVAAEPTLATALAAPAAGAVGGCEFLGFYSTPQAKDRF